MAEDKTAHCYVCGKDNPQGMHVHYEQDGEQGAMARTVARAEHAGWPGVQHGGVTFTLMDEAFGWALFFAEVEAVTARVETRFHKPIAVGSPLLVRARVTGRRRSLYLAHAEVLLDDESQTLLAEAEAVMAPSPR